MEKQNDIGVNRRIIVKKHEGVTIESKLKSVTLTPKRWSSFVASIMEIDQSLESLENNHYVKYSKHLGGGYYIGITTGFPCVDIREYYFNTTKKQKLPTNHGVAIHTNYWPKIREIVEQIRQDFPLENEHCSHYNLDDLFNCVECYPFKEEVESIKDQLTETFY